MTESTFEAVAGRLSRHGLATRGGFRLEEGEYRLDSGASARSAILVGNVGSAMWPHFAPFRGKGDHPLDLWSKEVLSEIARDVSAEAVFPSDGPPFLPFQAWAMRAEPVFPSPTGILIHPEYGLWHGYRGALIFEQDLPLPARAGLENPCVTCVDRPCISTCPVAAFGDGYDVPACAAHLRSGEGSACLERSCLARRACPVGRDHVYEPEHAAFHMKAFLDGLD